MKHTLIDTLCEQNAKLINDKASGKCAKFCALQI